MNHLRSCLQCARHIRITEAVCPFCAAKVPDERRTPPARGITGGRLGRTFALSALAATASTAGNLAACSSDDNGAPPILSAADAYGLTPLYDANQDSTPILGSADAYGAVPLDDAGHDSATDAPPDVITAADAYGAVEPDAAKDADPDD